MSVVGVGRGVAVAPTNGVSGGGAVPPCNLELPIETIAKPPTSRTSPAMADHGALGGRPIGGAASGAPASSIGGMTSPGVPDGFSGSLDMPIAPTAAARPTPPTARST